MGLFSKKRVEGYDFDKCHDTEGERLRIQSKILYNFDAPIYDDMFAGKLDLTVLDIGCNEGDSAMDRLNGRSVSTYIGVDRSQVAINNAIKKYADDSAVFLKMDIEDEKFPVQLNMALQRYGIDQVDIITISMVLLHLVDPATLLRNLYPFLKKGGTLFVKDIDDRDNRANPDPSGMFLSAYDIADYCKDSGNRMVAREIPSYMKSAGFKNIRCVRKGLSTQGMTMDERMALCETYFGFFLEDCERQVDYDEDDKSALYNLGWCHYYLPKIKEMFNIPEFTFILGFQTYLATKE